MPRQSYRSQISTIRDVLEVIADCGREGAISSSISRNANLSYPIVMETCQKLIDMGLLESKQNKRSHIFVVNEKGIQVLREIQNFVEQIDLMKIKI
ncbi:MAG: transcriptional regulator [Thaumarchaeota archaeon]|nr:transcriptional regulator [Nitrososphaerota archaeon]MDE1841416.1 transcriptional regulator [Nitrososphaerota archaeon]